MSRALDSHDVAFSSATFSEISEVLNREKFDPYASIESRKEFLGRLMERGTWVDESLLQPVTDCRDEKDNMFLALTLATEAEFPVTGDEDLLVLDPFRGTRIVTVRQFAELTA